MARRRALLAASVALPLGALGVRPGVARAKSAAPHAPATAEARARDQARDQALRAGLAAGGVLMFRHTLAPGTFDPPGFKLGDCATQRNLNDEGRNQARHIGAWFAERKLRPTRVRSSPWCRCVETARLAFGERVEVWPALGSPRAAQADEAAQALAQLRAALAAAVKRGVGFEAWVTHMFVFNALLGEGAGVGDAALLAIDAQGAPRVQLRLTGLFP